MAAVFERALPRASHGRQEGVFLLEALIAALIFGFGALAMAALQARATRDVNDAQFRAEAVQLVESGIATMRASTPASLYATFDSRADGPGYRAFRDRAKRLPGVTDIFNAPELRISDGPSAGSRRVDITVFWQAPGDPVAHRHSASAVVAGT
jgi:type IV pilus assembly protein PilV